MLDSIGKLRNIDPLYLWHSAQHINYLPSLVYLDLLLHYFYKFNEPINTINIFILFLNMYMFFYADKTTYGPINRAENTVQSPGILRLIGRSVIIITGSVISVVLVSLIIREICTCHRISTQTGLPQAWGGIYEDCWKQALVLLIIQVKITYNESICNSYDTHCSFSIYKSKENVAFVCNCM